ncbi:MAG TPA: hypothetical protein VFS43_03805 [Polyangiaceae bacterium]|nr:hypothetical protein [Polyangiaceae bacterium]
MALPALPAFKINGPFWTADADLLRFATPTRAFDLRELFVDLGTRNFTTSKALLPGTLLVLCWVRTVTIAPTAATSPVYTFKRKTGEAPPAETISAADAKNLILSGQIALLLVEADPNQWKGEDPARLGTVTCLSGHIALDVLQGETASRPALYTALDLVEATPAADRPGASALPGRVSVHATGVTIFGRARLPWEKDRVTAPLQLARVLPDPNPNLGGKVPTYRLTVEAERLTPAEREAIVAAWGRLATSIDPGNPALEIADPFCPRWVTLEVANPRDLPRMHWFIQPWKAAPASLPLHLEREELNLVLSDQAPFDQTHRATTLARTVLGSVTIARTEPTVVTDPATITITIAATRPDAGTVPGELNYAASVQAGAWKEQFTLSGVVTAYDPVETPRLLRESQDLATPEWAPGDEAAPLQPPVLWGFSPLEDGWAQLPVPNLTTRMYVDARLAREPSPTTALLAGAAAYGNDKRGALDEFPSEHAWAMTLLDADAVGGTWTLRQQGAAAPELAQIALKLSGPEVALSGLLWLARAKPTVEDALPSLDDWVTGLVPVTLRTVDPSVDVIPPLATVAVPQLSFGLRTGQRSDPSAALGAWSLSVGVDAALFQQMVAAKLLSADAFGQRLPLLWRRHRTLPMIQALPLTQSKSPPSHPSPSRQLVPFELPVGLHSATGLWVPSGWAFGRAAGDGAAAWPVAQGTVLPSHEWISLADLPLAALSLPGLVLDPRAAGRTGLAPDGATQLPQQYRHDLPYVDEAHALAQLPKVTRNPREVSPVPAAPRPEPPKPLTRELLAGHFRRLSERASLAALDAVAATSSAAGGSRVDALVEPLSWPVTAALTTGAYPGALTLTDVGGGSLSLEREAALKGVTGTFEQDVSGALRLKTAPTPGGYEIVAGSMAARRSDGSMRDQRGLLRGATGATARVLRTPVRLVDEAESFELTSLLEAVPLGLGPAGGAAEWRLWFRDLPASGGAFLRDRTRSPLAQDVNDPEASSRRYNHLNGWEWRLEPDAPGRYSLFGLEFFPLTLERVTLVGDDVRSVELVGRLQLPVEGASEIEALANAVRLTFEWDATAARLALSAVAPAGGPGEWPLALSAGASGDAPRIVWPQIALSPGRDALHLDGAQLAFQSFGADWRVPLARLAFAAGAGPIMHRYTASASPTEPLVPRQVELTIAPSGSGHAVTLLLGVRLGRGVATMPSGPRPVPLTWTKDAPLQDPRLDGVRSAFTGDVRFQLLGEKAGEVTWLAGYLFDDITLGTAPPSEAPEAATFLAGETSLEFRWETYALGPGSSALQLLPGMHVAAGAAPGFATCAFRTFTAANDVPTLRLTNSFVEAVVRCRWGAFLQGPPGEPAGALGRVCGSSAGDLVFGYTGESQGSAWDEQYLLNGFLEVKSLVSWPLAMAVDAADVRLTLPAARPAASLDHLRHTVRILFDQHAIPPGALETAEGDLVFRLAPQKAWHFLAAVEHQLVNVQPGPGFASPATQNDRRWVAVQEVHFVSPASVKAGLLAIKNDALKLQAPAGGTALVGDASYGLVGAGLRALLAEGTTPALDALPAGTMLVETSAVHWLKELPANASAPTALQYLPNGTQLAALSGPDDYAPTDPRDPAWLLLQMPFVGRLQDQARDALAPPPGAPTPPLLQVDPVLDLHRRKATAAPLPPLLLAFTAWAESAPVTVTFSAFDGAAGRQFARLDPRALEESWFYAQNKGYEPTPEGIRSVLASAPDTVARLGRPTVLAHLYRGSRGFYPPQWNPNGEPVVADGTSDQLAWRPNHLFVLQAVASASPSAAPPYGWLAVGLQLVTGLLRRSAGATFASRRHVAATQIPMHVAGTLVPSGLAVSPFLSLEFRPAPAATELRFVIAELLALNAGTGRLRPVASQSWEISEATAGREREFAATWARETHRRLSPESPIAVLRYRELRQAAPGAPASAAVLVTSYGFGLVPGVQPPRTLAKRVFRLRSPVSQLRFRDGRFGGAEAPRAVRPFELAPPQTNGVQPLHLGARPAAATAEAAWPWGFAGLRTSVQYTEAKEGVTGRAEAADAEGFTLWWQSIQHAVHYRSGLGPDPAAGLPPDFRGGAIRNLLPVLPDPPLPALDPAEVFQTAAAPGARRQPVLPGSVRTTLVGARAGAFLSLRPQLTRQSGLGASPGGPPRGKALSSGSVPAQHRAPRPVPLPPNNAASRDAALQPWASWFEPGVGLLARSAPADEAFFAAFDAEPAHRLQIKIVTPDRGQIDAEWDGTITADVALDGPESSIDEWALSVAIHHGGRTVRYLVEPPDGQGPEHYTLRPHPDDVQALRDLLTNLAPGEPVTLAARVSRAAGADGFSQKLAFPLRAADPGAQRLPLEPFFVLFGDPEYDRLLASPSKNATGPVKVLENDKPVLRSVTLSTDRAEYDPSSQLAIRYDWDDGRDHEAELSVDLVDATGLARPLTLLGEKLIRVRAHTLRTFTVLELLDGGEPAQFVGGETLLLKLTIAATQGVVEATSVVVAVNVSAEPVTPVPQAAYALLRAQKVGSQPQVECVRFAFSPPATRVELVCPDDLRTGVVRRRAVFLWTDTARAGITEGFAVQKIALTGSTHFPQPEVLERAAGPSARRRRLRGLGACALGRHGGARRARREREGGPARALQSASRSTSGSILGVKTRPSESTWLSSQARFSRGDSPASASKRAMYPTSRRSVSAALSETPATLRHSLKPSPERSKCASLET